MAAAAAATETAATEVGAAEGPVLSVINKRLRNLRKKLNRITQMEEAISQGKLLNKEQQLVYSTKPSVTASIDELEKLSPLLSAAAAQEVDLAKSSTVNDLLTLLYFATAFDLKTQGDFASLMLTRTHERGCCLSYDYVSPLLEADLDSISLVGSLLVSRPVDTNRSHQISLEHCVERAKLWISASNRPILRGSTVTYSGLREKLVKVMSSPYFTTAPEMKAQVEVAAAAAAAAVAFGAFQPEELDVLHQHKEEALANGEGSESYDRQFNTVEESIKGGHEVEKSAEKAAQSESSDISQAEGEPSLKDVELKDQDQQYIPQRQHQNQRGGRGSGGRRGYSNGRGGRNGNGSSMGGQAYQNGHSQYHDHNPRNYVNNRGNGGGKGAAGNYNHRGAAATVESLPR